MKFSEKQLRSAAKQAALLLADAYPTAPDHPFSERFHHRMDLLLAKRKKLVRAKQRLDRIKYTAAAVIISILLTALFFPEVRAKLKDWILETSGTTYHYFIDEAPPTVIPLAYQPTWVPEGYELYEKESTAGSTIYLYTGPTGMPLTVTYTQMEQNTPLSLTPIGEYSIKHCMIHGNRADLFISQSPADCNTVIWYVAEYGVAIYVSAYLEEADILKIAEKILPIYGP